MTVRTAAERSTPELPVLFVRNSDSMSQNKRSIVTKEFKKSKEQRPQKDVVEDRTRIERVTVRTAAERSTSELPVHKLPIVQ